MASGLRCVAGVGQRIKWLALCCTTQAPSVALLLNFSLSLHGSVSCQHTRIAAVQGSLFFASSRYITPSYVTWSRLNILYQVFWCSGFCYWDSTSKVSFVWNLFRCCTSYQTSVLLCPWTTEIDFIFLEETVPWNIYSDGWRQLRDSISRKSSRRIFIESTDPINLQIIIKNFEQTDISVKQVISG